MRHSVSVSLTTIWTVVGSSRSDDEPFLNKIHSNHIRWLVCQKQLSRTDAIKYIPQILWDVITCSCPWNLLLAHKLRLRIPRTGSAKVHENTTVRILQLNQKIWQNVDHFVSTLTNEFVTVRPALPRLSWSHKYICFWIYDLPHNYIEFIFQMSLT